MEINIIWFRRDLRLDDNTALYHALQSGKNVLPIFIFDQNILDRIDNKYDARVHFIHTTISKIKNELNELGSDLSVLIGNPLDCINELLSKYSVKAIYYNRDYESYSIKRDTEIENLCHVHGIKTHSFKDHIIFEGQEITKDKGDPYVVFTPYKKKWLQKLNNDNLSCLKSFRCKKLYSNFISQARSELITLEQIGFKKINRYFPPSSINKNVIKDYDEKRDFPSIKGTSRLGIHLRFGTISIREKVKKAYNLNEVFLSELIWRDFYSMILQMFPRVEKESFRKKYENIPWRNNEKEFELWCAGKTGYPLVDAGMRELNTTGFMHNRVRMVVASFLTKHLLIDWRWGEAYFADKLLDFELASNNGGWQWAAGCGTDAAPYFRIFNPESQRKKFDPENIYIKKYVPEFGSSSYSDPIVDHRIARERCLELYKKSLADN